MQYFIKGTQGFSNVPHNRMLNRFGADNYCPPHGEKLSSQDPLGRLPQGPVSKLLLA